MRACLIVLAATASLACSSEGIVDAPGAGAAEERRASAATGESQTTCVDNAEGINASMRADIGTAWIEGDHVHAGFGFNRRFGNIVTELWLRAAQDTGAAFQVLKNNFAPAVAWQSSILLEDGETRRMNVFNQGSGCCGAGMWGQSASAAPQGLGLVSTSWYPLYSDHYHPDFDGWDHTENLRSVFTSPCPNKPAPIYAADEQSHLFAELIAAPDAGKAIRLRFEANYRWKETKRYKSFQGEVGMYFNGTAAEVGALRLWLVGGGGAKVDGPIPVHQARALAAQGRCYATQHYTTTYWDKDDSTCITHITDDLDYAVLAWTAGGRDMALAIQAAGHGATFNFARMGNPAYHPAAREPSFNYHTWVERKGDVTLQAGAINQYSVVYTIGTLRQLAALGFRVTPPAPCSLCLGPYADCNAACQAFGKHEGSCRYPDSIQFGQCCECREKPCGRCLGSFSDCDAACRAFGGSGGSCGWPDSEEFGRCCKCH